MVTLRKGGSYRFADSTAPHEVYWLAHSTSDRNDSHRQAKLRAAVGSCENGEKKVFSYFFFFHSLFFIFFHSLFLSFVFFLSIYLLLTPSPILNIFHLFSPSVSGPFLYASQVRGVAGQPLCWLAACVCQKKKMYCVQLGKNRTATFVRGGS